MEKLVDLTSFRLRNGLSQTQLAKVFNTSAAFISQVETGASKMPAEKVKLIFALSEDNQWMTDGLIPARERLSLLDDYIFDSGEKNYNAYKQKLKVVLTGGLENAIMLGQAGIDSALADRIISICPPKLKPQKNWLMTGEGSIYSWLDELANPKEMPDSLEGKEAMKMLHMILEKVEIIERDIEVIKKQVNKT